MPKQRVRRLIALTGAGLRRALYPLLALPVGVVSLVLILIGRPAAASLQRGLLGRLLRLPVAEPSARQVITYSVVSLPVAIVAFLLAAYLWAILPLNLGYPLRAGTTAESLRDAWGGPTLAGAWTVHAVGGVLFFLLVGLPIMNATAWLQGRLAQRLLGVPPLARLPGRHSID